MVKYIILIYVVSFIMSYYVLKYYSTHDENGDYRPNSWTLGIRRTDISISLIPVVNSYVAFLGTLNIIYIILYNKLRGPWLVNLIEAIFQFYENDKEVKW